MNSEAIMAMSDAYVMGTYSRFPVALVRGEGCRVWDADGREYLDFVAGIAVCALGHGHPAMAEAIHKVVESGLLHCSNLYYIESQALLARRLAEKSGLDRAFFCNSGAEANEAAIKLARRWAWKKGRGDRVTIVAAEQSFHGRTMAALTATGQPKYHEGFSPLPNGFRHVPYNDLEALAEAVRDDTCAVLLEPIQGEGGLRPADPDYLRGVEQLCRERDVLFMMDEVQTGMGRTGAWFGFQHYGVTPDVVTLAKGLGGGVPIGACLARGEAAEALEPGTHASTFGGNPFVCRVALAVMDVMERDNLPERARVMGERLGDGLRELMGRFPRIRDVRGRGLMWGLEWDGPVAGIVRRAMEKGLLLVSAGPNVVRFVPPLIVSETELHQALLIVEACLAEEEGKAAGGPAS